MALALHAGDDAPERPALETAAAWRGMLRLSLRGAPLLWARVWPDHYGWTWMPAQPSPPLLAPIRADEARALSAGAPSCSEAWWSAWSFRLAGELGAIVVSRRTPLVWLVPLDERAPVPLRMDPLLPFEPGEVSWDQERAVIPLRPWPVVADARVKALRKLAREGALPPVVVAWSSALQCHVLLDGHARLVAARDAGVRAPVLAVARMVAVPRDETPEQRDRLASALTTLEALATRDGPRANLAAIEAARIASRLGSGPTVEWHAVDRAAVISGEIWRREVRRALRGRRDWLASALLAP